MARQYLVHDVIRIGEMLDLPLAWPSPDPIAMNVDTGEVYADQPYISRLTRLAIAAGDAGLGIEFALQVSRLIFGGTKNWHEGDHLRAAVSRAGLDIGKLDDVVVNDVDRLEAAIKKNEADHQAAGHWGVPLMTFQNEPFFGQDRYDVLMWRLRQHGLKARTRAGK
jgi:2-hydroxychromene-2-carboxylate isomerase